MQLAERKGLPGAVQDERLLQVKGVGGGIILAKGVLIVTMSLSPWVWQGMSGQGPP